MSSLAQVPAAAGADDFQALEQRVLRTVELIRQEREARAAAEAVVAGLREEIELHSMQNAELEAELSTLRHERDQVRVRVEKLLHQMDELA